MATFSDAGEFNKNVLVENNMMSFVQSITLIVARTMALRLDPHPMSFTLSFPYLD